MKIIRTSVIFAGLGLIVVAGSANIARPQSAPPAETMQAARDLVALVTKETMRQMVQQVTAQVWPRIEQSLRAKQSITDSQLSDLRKEYERIQFEFIPKVMDDAPSIYARHFTASELRELLAFYQTPLGEKSLRVLPQVTAETMASMMPRMQQLQTQVLEAFVKVLRERGFNI